MEISVQKFGRQNKIERKSKKAMSVLKKQDIGRDQNETGRGASGIFVNDDHCYPSVDTIFNELLYQCNSIPNDNNSTQLAASLSAAASSSPSPILMPFSL